MNPRKFPLHPAQPHRICWGCDRYCAADALACGNGSVRTPHPSELFGDDWAAWGLDPLQPPAGEADAETALSPSPPDPAAR